jgi:hypothetical protein
LQPATAAFRCEQGECDKVNERASHAEVALAAAQEAHKQTQGALLAETDARTEAEAKVCTPAAHRSSWTASSALSSCAGHAPTLSAR